MKAENVHPLKNFDPLDQKHLMNPEFKDANIEVRTQQMQPIFDKQINRTLDFLRPPVKLAVARDFQKKRVDHFDLPRRLDPPLCQYSIPSQQSEPIQRPT